MTTPLLGLILWLTGLAAFGATQPAPEVTAWRLLPQVQVHASGVYLNELIENPPLPLPHVRLGAAPSIGQAMTLSRAQVTELVRQAVPELVNTNWTGPTQVRVVRRVRPLEEAEVKDLLTAALQRDYVKERGDVELRFTRPWPATPIADEPFTLNIVDLPSAGVSANFILRFELRSDQSLLGNWQVPVQARVWREVWVTSAPVQRGQPLKSAEIVRQRRDVLTLRDALPAVNFDDPGLEFAENIPAGLPLTTRSLRLRPIVQRGRLVDAIVQEGSLIISTKAEVLEDGLPGQWVRARNIRSKREFRGKVQNEETIQVAF